MPRAPRKPTYAEQKYSRAKTKQIERAEPPRAKAKPTLVAPRVKHKPALRGSSERTAPGPSSAAVERYKRSPEYKRTLAAARETKKPKKEEEGRLERGLALLEKISGGTAKQAEAREGKGGGKTLSTGANVAYASLNPLAPLTNRLPIVGKISKNVPADVGELVATTPTSIAHLAKTAVTEPQKVPKMLADPYIEVAKHPIRELTERPVSTLAMVVPAAKVPGRVGGKVARKTGKQTLERPSATLPGTALKETRTGSRDVIVRQRQARRDRKAAARGEPAPTVRASDVKRRVDEFYDFSRHRVQQAADVAAKEVKDRRMDREAGEAHIEQARTRAGHDMEAAFAREFGANARPQVGAAELQATVARREKAAKRKQKARKRERKAQQGVVRALDEARAARGTGTSGRLTALEAERVAAVKALAGERTGQTAARLEEARAHGAAAVSQARPRR